MKVFILKCLVKECGDDGLSLAKELRQYFKSSSKLKTAEHYTVINTNFTVGKQLFRYLGM